MSKLFKSILGVTAVAGLLVSSAASAARAPDILRYIPADSPYVIAVTDSLPKDVYNKLEPAVEQILASYQVILRHTMNDVIAKAEAESGESDAETNAKIRGLTDELIGILSMDGLRDAGLETNGLAAFYGYGLLPVLRVQLSDEELFDAAVARVETKSGESLQVSEVGGESYKFAAVEGVRVIIATIDNQAVITVVPEGLDDGHIGAILGTKKLRNNIKRAKTLRNIAKEYGYKGYTTGYVNIEAIANAFIGDRTPIDQAIAELVLKGEDDPAAEISDACRAEYLELAAVMPRMVFGYSTMTTESMNSSLVFELREDIAAGLATLPAAVPGLGQDAGGLMSFGMSINPLALQNFFKARIEALEADPFECPDLSDMQAIAPQGRQMLAQPIPPVVYGIRGFVANIVDVEGMDLETETPPTSVDGSILFAVENAESLVMMAAMMDPQLAALNIMADGKPVALTMEQVTSTVGEAFAAMTSDALSISVGEGAEQAAADLLVADSADPAPFMSMAFDSKRYYDMIGTAMMQAQVEDDESGEVPAAVQGAIADLMTASGDLYDRIAVGVMFTERGIEIDGRVTLGE